MHQMSFLEQPADIIARAGTNINDSNLLALLQEATKGIVKRKRGKGKTIWDRFVAESHFCWNTGTSQPWTIPQDIFGEAPQGGEPPGLPTSG